MRVIGLALLLLLSALAIARSAYGTRLDSFTVDEPWHIVAGASYVRDGGRHLNPEHPPLVKLWVGAWMPDGFRLLAKPALRDKGQEREWVEQTMFEHNDAIAAQQRARAAMWALSGALLVLLGALLWRAAGLAWALGTLGFLALEPTIGAHLPVVMTDGLLALTLTPAIVATGLLLATWRWPWVVAVGITVGLALMAKHSALAGLAGLALVMLVGAVWDWRRIGASGVAARLGKLVVAALLGVALLWASYGGRFHADADGGDAFNRPLADKIAEVSTPSLKRALQLADDYRLLPRAYLWGLADTVRTGVEGRGGAVHLVWGKRYEGRTPWFTWPAIVAAKLPLALSALTLLGLALLAWRAALPPAVRWMLAALGVASLVHLLALMASPQAWGGVRHATPLLVAAAVVAGGAVSEAWRRRARGLQGGVVILFLAAFAMTIGTPRLWEYHNELAGGSAEGFRYFKNEGLDLGQRFHEIHRFHDAVIAPSGEPMYDDYWMMERQVRAAGLNYHRFVESLDDTNVAGVYEGYFVYPNSSKLAMPEWDWNPREVFREMTEVAQLGYVTIWHGRLVRPRARAHSMNGTVMEYIHEKNGDDWSLVAARLEEVAGVAPGRPDTAAELGNAYVRLGDKAKALRAYRRLLEQDEMPVDAKVAGEFRQQIARLEQAGDDLSGIPMVRNPWLE